MKLNKAIFSVWAKCAAVRALKTFAEAALAAIGTSALLSEINWAQVASTAVLASIISVLASCKGLPEVEAKKD